MSIVRKAVPWILAVAILYFLFRGIDLTEVWEAAGTANLPLFLSMLMGCVLLWFLIDSAAFAFIFSRFNDAGLAWGEARSLRGLTYMLTPINWNLGTAAVILHLRKSKQIGAVESSSTMLFYQMIDGLVLGAFALLGVLMLPSSSETAQMRNLAMGVVIFQVLPLVFFSRDWFGVSLIERYRQLAIFRSHRGARPRDVGILLLMKGLYYAVFLGVYWQGAQAFGISLPLSVAVAASPLIILTGALPFTPAGLGTQQAAMLFFFEPYGDEPAILAFGLIYPLALVFARALLGLPYLKDLPKMRTDSQVDRDA